GHWRGVVERRRRPALGAGHERPRANLQGPAPRGLRGLSRAMATTAAIVGSGTHTYEAHEDWAVLPNGWEMPAAAGAEDAEDRVYCFNRDPDHPVVVFDRDGHYLSSWGAGRFAFPHTIRVDAADNLWLVDRDHGQMLYCTLDGTVLRTIGTRGYRSDTGVD